MVLFLRVGGCTVSRGGFVEVGWVGVRYTVVGVFCTTYSSMSTCITKIY